MTEETAAAETTETEVKAKKTKEPRVEDGLYCTDAANGEGTVHAQIQKFVFDNPGSTRAAIVAALSGKIDTKKAPATDRFVSSYVAGGQRRGYLTTDASKAATTFPVKPKSERTKSEKTPSDGVTKQGRVILDAMEAKIAEAGVERTTAISTATLVELLGKPMAHLARTFNKLVTDGYVTAGKDEEGKTNGYALTEKTAPAPAAADETPAAE